MRIHSPEEDGVSEDSLEQGGVKAGEVIRVFIIYPVLCLVIVTVLQRGARELGITKTQTIASCQR